MNITVVILLAILCAIIMYIDIQESTKVNKKINSMEDKIEILMNASLEEYITYDKCDADGFVPDAETNDIKSNETNIDSVKYVSKTQIKFMDFIKDQYGDINKVDEIFLVDLYKEYKKYSMSKGIKPIAYNTFTKISKTMFNLKLIHCEDKGIDKFIICKNA